jgi:hypothetical protein
MGFSFMGVNLSPIFPLGEIQQVENQTIGET